MRKILGLLPLLMLVAGCVESVEMTDDNRSLVQVVRVYTACVRGNAARLDDHVTPPATLGQEIANVCSAEYEAANAVAIRGVDPESARTFLAERARTATKTPTNTVKALRAMQEAQNNG